MERHGGVERGLAAEGGEQHELARCRARCRRSMAPVAISSRDDDLLDALGRDRLDVGAVGELRIGHDGGRVGVHQDDAVALLLEGLAGLGAGIVELARLADDDRAGADDEDGVNVSALRHTGRRLNGIRPAMSAIIFAHQSKRAWRAPGSGRPSRR